MRFEEIFRDCDLLQARRCKLIMRLMHQRHGNTNSVYKIIKIIAVLLEIVKTYGFYLYGPMSFESDYFRVSVI